MTTAPAAATTPAAPAASNSDTTALGRARLADNFNTFLSLLTTQLKNQDPLSPLDSNQFTQQLVQMTGVEQQLASNDLLKQLVANTGTGISTAVSLIGKDVRAASDSTTLSGGQAKWTYKLDAAATDAKIEVLDANGKVVHAEAPTDNKIGDHPFAWDGKDMTGNQLPDGGTYSLRVTAVDAAGKAVTATPYVLGRVTGVEQIDGSTFITINGAKVAWEKVTSISEPDPTQTVTSPTTTTA